MDALRADHLGCYGYHRNTSPFIDRLETRSSVFTEAYSASCHTREALPAILTGHYPDQALHRYYRLRKSPVSTILQDAGYATGAFVTAPFLTRANGYAAGFDTFWSSYDHHTWNLPNVLEYAREIAANHHYAPGGWVNAELADFIDHAGQPFFAWGHYTDVHAPYNRYTHTYFGENRSPRFLQYLFRRAKYWPGSITDEERQVLVDAYDNSIREVDWWLQQLFERLHHRGLLTNTVVILTADHGELFGDHGLYEHRRFLTEELLHVPLLVYDATRQPAAYDHTVASVDIPATICELAGVDAGELEGASVFKQWSRMVTATCVRRGRRKVRVI